MKSRKQRRDIEHDTEIDETRIYNRPEITSRARKRSWSKLAGMIILGVTLFLGGMGYGMYSYLKGYSRGYPPSSGISTIDESDPRMNILVLGIDGGVDGKLLRNSKTGTRSDVMMVVSVEPNSKTIGVLSIPRDTRLYIPKVNDLEKAAHAHAYGGPELVVQTLEEFLKVDIHRYVRVDFEGFKKIVDRLGGVYVDVPEDMDYEDPYQNLYIHLKEGPQPLDGDKSLQFVRYREYVDGDISRIRAQKLFLNALAEKLLSISTVPKIPQLVSDIMPYVVTDLTNEDITFLASVGLGMKLDNVEMETLPGDHGYIGDISYWLVDSEKAAQMVDKVIRGVDRAENSNVKVAVQNGCGVSGAADYIASILRGYGFNVVSVGNADRFDYDETKILAPKGKQDIQTEILKSVKMAAGQAKAYTSDEIPEETDVVVIIGKDFRMSGK